MNRTLILITIVLCLAAAVPAVADPHLSRQQIWTLHEAETVGARFDTGKTAEFAFVPTLQAILSQESSLCVQKHKVGTASWGCGQLIVKTARLFDPHATAHRLLTDNHYNIVLTARYLAFCRDHTGTWSEMVRCYRGRDTRHWRAYVAAIRKRLHVQRSDD